MVAHVVVVLFTGFMIYTAWPGSSLFSWHPTLMSLAFITCMFEGLLVFNPQSSLLLKAAYATKVSVHQFLQIGAVIFALGGFAVIYYNKNLNGAAHFTSWHGLFGVTTVVYITIQAFGGDLIKYPWLRKLLRVNQNLAALKIYHATSGLIAFTLVTVTLMLALYSNWFTSRVSGLLWYPCLGSVSFMAMITMNRVVGEYLPRTQRQPQQPTARKATGASKKSR